jgi:predicted methyltransferase MtxX (methanogen marker protein 4)
MAKIARANFQKVVDVLGSLQSYWGGVRYIRSVLVQKGEGAAHLSLVGDDEDVTVPDRVSEWIANASSKQNSDSESNVALS